MVTQICQVSLRRAGKRDFCKVKKDPVSTGREVAYKPSPSTADTGLTSWRPDLAGRVPKMLCSTTV